MRVYAKFKIQKLVIWRGFFMHKSIAGGQRPLVEQEHQEQCPGQQGN